MPLSLACSGVVPCGDPLVAVADDAAEDSEASSTNASSLDDDGDRGATLPLISDQACDHPCTSRAGGSL